jgi:hypothetical protein
LSTKASSSIERLFWLGGEDVSLGRMLAAGALLAAIYGALQLAVNGVFFDEIVVPAQIIAGAVRYPAGHPHQLYYPQLFNLPNYLAAALWRIVPDALVLSAIRNFLFLFVSVFAPYAVTVLLTRKPMWGHIAVALTLTETGLRFWGIYPMWIFPGYISHGHLGLHIALLAAVLLLARRWWIGGLLIGLLPALHGAMILIVWPWSFSFLVFSRERPRGRDRFQFFAAAAIGLAICVALAGVVHLQKAHATVAPPYDVQGNGESIQRNFIEFFDFHRRLFDIVSFGYLTNQVAFAALATLLLVRGRQRRSTNSDRHSRTGMLWILCFGVTAWAWVFGARWMKILTGTMPAPLEMLMPYRFSNFSALLLIPLTVAVAAAVQEDIRDYLQGLAWLAWSTLIGAAGVLLLFEGSVFAWLYQGRVKAGLIFVVWGILFALELFARRPDRAPRLVAWAAFLSILGSLLLVPQHTSAVILLISSFVLAAVLALAAGRFQLLLDWEAPHRRRALQVGLLLAVVFASAAALRNGKTDFYGIDSQRWDMFSLDDRELIAWLQTNARPHELILPAGVPRSSWLQLKAGFPMLLQGETYQLITYAPRLAPTVGKMSRELYGINLEDREELKRLGQNRRVEIRDVWRDPWKRRTRAEWQLLGRKYGFRLVLCPVDVSLDLPEALAGRLWTLYTIPGVAESEINAAGKAGLPTNQR